MSRKTHLISLVLEASGRWHTHYLIDFIDEFFMALKRTLKKHHLPCARENFLGPPSNFPGCIFTAG